MFINFHRFTRKISLTDTTDEDVVNRSDETGENNEEESEEEIAAAEKENIHADIKSEIPEGSEKVKSKCRG